MGLLAVVVVDVVVDIVGVVSKGRTAKGWGL
jgi:hypothetical protein